MPLWPFSFFVCFFFQKEAAYTVALALGFVKWKHGYVFQDLTGSVGEWYHAVSNYITLGFSFFSSSSSSVPCRQFSFFFCDLFFLSVFRLDNINPLLLFVFFHKWTACGRMEMIWLKWLQGHCGWLLGCPEWSLGSCQVVCGCDAPSNQHHFGICMRKMSQFLQRGPLESRAPPSDRVLSLAAVHDATSDEVTRVFVRPRIQLSTLIRSTGCTCDVVLSCGQSTSLEQTKLGQMRTEARLSSGKNIKKPKVAKRGEKKFDSVRWMSKISYEPVWNHCIGCVETDFTHLELIGRHLLVKWWNARQCKENVGVDYQ